MARRNLAEVFLSVTTSTRSRPRDGPRASAPSAGWTHPCDGPRGVGSRRDGADDSGLNDHEMENLDAAVDAGATRALRARVCRWDQAVRGMAEDAWPDRAERVLSLIRQMRGGKLTTIRSLQHAWRGSFSALHGPALPYRP